MLGPMSARFRQSLARVLIAIMALLPLQGVLAALPDSTGDQACQHQRMTDGMHASGHQTHKAKCCLDMQAPAAGGNDHQCDSSCNHCGAGTSAAVLNNVAYSALPQLRRLPQQDLHAGQPQHGRTPLFRPPKTFL